MNVDASSMTDAEGTRSRRARFEIGNLGLYAALFAALCLVIAAGLMIGAGDLGDAKLSNTFLTLRATRLAAALLSGAALATGGVLVQGLFRNPLADPSILGATAGASLGGRVTMLLFQALSGTAIARVFAPEMLLPLGCVLGACGALALLLAVHRSGDDIVVLLLTGFLLSSLFLSLGSFVTTLALERWELARAMMDFSLGDVSSVGIQRVWLATPMIVAGVIAAYLWSAPLDLMLSGEEEATALGVDVHDVRRACVLWTALLSAAAVALGGNLSFVGLVVPHVLRPFVGVRHRRLVPASALLGGVFVAACDVLTRALPTRAEIPLGVVTGLVGAPLFLILLLRARREVMHG